MNIEVKRVGKRWFICTGEGIKVEANRGIRTRWVMKYVDNRWEYDMVTKTNYTLTGKGARKNRAEIEAAIENYIEQERLEKFKDA